MPAYGTAKCLLIVGTQFHVWNRPEIFFGEKSGQELFGLTHTRKNVVAKIGMSTEASVVQTYVMSHEVLNMNQL
jgi:hypothetical protein